MSGDQRQPHHLVYGDDALAVAVARRLLAAPGTRVTLAVPEYAVELVSTGLSGAASVLVADRLDAEVLARCGRVDTVTVLRQDTALHDALLARAHQPQARLVIRTELLADTAPYDARGFSPASTVARAYLSALASTAPRRPRALPTIRGARRTPYLRRILRNQLRARAARVALVALALALVSTMLLAVLHNLSVGQALYLTLLRSVAEPDLAGGTAVQLYQVCFALLTVLGSVTTGVYLGDALQQGRTLAAAGLPPAGIRGHVVVAGLGERGTHLVRALHDAGDEIVAIDTQPTARGVRAARRRDIPVIVDDARWPDTLLHAALDRSRALLVATPDDDTGLAIVTAAQTIRPELPIVWLPRDDDLAALAGRLPHVAVPDATLDDIAAQATDLLTDHQQHQPVSSGTAADHSPST
ncbi:NAD(P)-binding protein [Micromonospora sp. NBRC 101691]|uniref:NAD(P)-binding protein n=1 Tax=Micromonospora sp. NBRC 101691 TaxID=3032198 RepID=UPI002557176F|nr:NAD(P)-binding protein [Micromonospora sp. NBRC 101691]